MIRVKLKKVARTPFDQSFNFNQALISNGGTYKMKYLKVTLITPF
jgi:hypothetical protein